MTAQLLYMWAGLNSAELVQHRDVGEVMGKEVQESLEQF